MKTIAVLVSLLMISYFCFVAEGYAQNPADSGIQPADLKEISLSGNDKRDVKTLSDPDKIKSLFGAVQERFQADGCSENLDDLKPLIGTKWLMAYEVQSSVYTDVLIFDSVITVIPDSNNIFSLCGHSQKNREGCVFYVNSTQYGGPCFALALDGTQLDLYFFTLNGDVAKGVCYKDNKEQELTGIRWGGNIGCDVNGDNKIGLAEVICQLKIISGCDSTNDDCCPLKSISGSRSNLKSNPE